MFGSGFISHLDVWSTVLKLSSYISDAALKPGKMFNTSAQEKKNILKTTESINRKVIYFRKSMNIDIDMVPRVYQNQT